MYITLRRFTLRCPETVVLAGNGRFGLPEMGVLARDDAFWPEMGVLARFGQGPIGARTMRPKRIVLRETCRFGQSADTHAEK